MDTPAESVFISFAELNEKEIEVTTDKGLSTLSPNPYAPLSYFVRVCGGYRGFTRKALARAFYQT